MNQHAPWFMTRLECAISSLQQLMLLTGFVCVRWRVVLAVIVVMQRYLIITHREVTINAHMSCDKEAAS